jgi:hypothetical protein
MGLVLDELELEDELEDELDDEFEDELDDPREERTLDVVTELTEVFNGSSASSRGSSAALFC